MAKHTVRHGECISSIADKYGFFADTLWNHPQNSSLKKKRVTPNQLYEGDKVVIPDKTKKEETCTTEATHRFRRLGTPIQIKLKIQDEGGETVANTAYEIWIPGQDVIRGRISDKGVLTANVPADTRNVDIILPEMDQRFELHIGNLDPVSRITGVQQRLGNLGYDPGPIEGTLNDQTKLALRDFQLANGLDPTGMADEETRHKLEQLHDGETLNQDCEDDTGAALPVEGDDSFLAGMHDGDDSAEEEEEEDEEEWGMESFGYDGPRDHESNSSDED